MGVGYRCDLDMMFFLNSGTVLLPFKELVDAMKFALRNVHHSITRVGLENAKTSRKFLAKHHAKPHHVLYNLSQSLLPFPRTSEAVAKLREEFQWKQDLAEKQNDSTVMEWAGKLVQGRTMYMTMMPDGAMVPSESEEGKEYTRQSSSSTTNRFSKDTRNEPRRMNTRSHRSTDEGYISQTRPSIPNPIFQPLSSWDIDVIHQRTPNDVITESAEVDDGFDYLLEPQKSRNTNESLDTDLRKKNLTLDWQGRNSGTEDIDEVDTLVDEITEEDNGDDNGKVADEPKLVFEEVMPLDSDDLRQSSPLPEKDSASSEQSTDSKHNVE